MSANDITMLNANSLSHDSAVTYNVAAGVTTINRGEPVARALGGITVTAAATATPVVATDFYVGIAVSKSTQTAAAAGTVEVAPLKPNTIYLINPNVAATWDTQAEYDALVGKRVVFDLTAGTYTILAADAATNGLVVAPLDIAKFPGKVAFFIRNGVDSNA